MARLTEGISAVFFPPRCVFCKRKLVRGESGICADCVRELPRRSPEREDRDGFVSAICAPLEFSGRVREALHRYKFGGKTAYAGVFGRLVADCVRENLAGEYDLVSWVPLSEERMAERGYDQAMLIAMAAALELDDVAVETLRRTLNTAPQSSMRDAASRRGNIAGAYQTLDAELVNGRRVLLIDDIITTGSTVSECARTLLEAGCAGVVCASVARPAKD